ncbi:MAG: alpha/beta hydrolase [archaeon]
MEPLWYKYTKGDSDKPVLCFLHGLAGSSSIYSETVKYFSKKGYNILIIDLLGHGLSDKESDINLYKFTTQCKYIKRIVDKEQIPHVILIGHCLGSLLCQEFCRLYEKNVLGLILINSHYKIRSNNMIQLKINLMKVLVKLFILLGLFKRGILGHDTYSKYAKTADFSPTRFFLSDIKYTSAKVMQYYYKLTSEYENTELDKIKCPVLLIHGKKDTFFDYKISLEMSEKIPNSMLRLIENGNHILSISNNEKMNKLILEFIKTFQIHNHN